MAERMLRQGLPRVRGGEPWPAGGAVAVQESVAVQEPVAEPDEAQANVQESVAAPGAAAASAAAGQTPATDLTPAAEPVEATASAPTASGTLRRGLPRESGGEPWPPATGIRATSAQPADRSTSQAPETAAAAAPAAAAVQSTLPTHVIAEGSVAPVTVSTDGPSLRRGLPRVAGGEAWPAAGSAVVASAAPVENVTVAANTVEEVPGGVAEVEQTALVSTPVIPRDLPPLPFRRTAWFGGVPRQNLAEENPNRTRPTWVQVIAGLFGAAGLGILAAALVALVRAVLSAPPLQDFLATYPGMYEPAVHVEPGFAPWVGWQHFFNMFLMILIIRSGLRLRTEKRPTAFWTPKGNSKGKISLTLWFHQALDLLWIINGVIFIVLLFATGHWARIVPTSWEVIPNAISAGLQYVSLDWPHENGWNNYNSLQQLAYFATVFLAAPLAIVTGFRMSGLWPKKAEKLSKAYPIEWARAVHFPVMLYFVAFIIVHVALVMFTGFLANLNHMYASSDAVGWTGFWVFVASLVVIAIGWFAARPLVIAPIAKLFGQVSSR